LNKNILLKFEIKNNNYNKIDLYHKLKEIFNDILFCDWDEKNFFIGGNLKKNFKILFKIFKEIEIFDIIKDFDIYIYKNIEFMIYDILNWTKKNNISHYNGFKFPYEDKYIRKTEKKFRDIKILKINPDKYNKKKIENNNI